MSRIPSLFCSMAVLAVAVPALAASPAIVLPVQGALRTASGGAVADGSYALTFALYDAKDAPKAAWTEIHVAVPVQAGLLALQIGAKDADKPLTVQQLKGDERWLGVTVGGDPELPRVRLGTVPYAAVAAHALVADALAAPLPGSALATGTVGADKLAFGYAASDQKGGPATAALQLACTGCIGADHIAQGAIPPSKLQMGKGSGLDADLLAGLPATDYLKKSEISPDSLALTGERNVDDGVPAYVVVRAPDSGVYAKAVLDAFALPYLVPLSQQVGFVETSDVDFGDGLHDKTAVQGAGADAGLTLPAGTGDGSDGPLLVNGGTKILNEIATRAAGKAGAKVLAVASTLGFAKGQALLLHQTRGPTAGTWELAKVASVDGNAQLTLVEPLAATYADGGGPVAQAVVVPQFTDVTVLQNAAVTAPAWNGATGGILALLATGKVQIAGSLHMAGRGYAGGKHGPSGADYVHNQQGESGLGLGGKSDAANGAGGGSGCGQASGAGGGHGAAGADGEKSGCTCDGVPKGGEAAGDAQLGKLLFGGGGGASGSHGGGGRDGAPGGAGGGIVLLVAKSVDVSGTVAVDGAAGGGGYFASGASQPMGGGGGGAGGAIRIAASSVTISGDVRATGGGGGQNNAQGSCAPSGKGGAGAIGRILLSAAAVTGKTSPAAVVEAGGPGGPLAGVYVSDVKDTLIQGAKLYRAEWTAQAVAGAKLVVSVRAADQPFAAAAAAPTWTVVPASGADPGLKGRHVQYRAELTAGEAGAPVLQDVKLSTLGATQLTTLPKGVALVIGGKKVPLSDPNPVKPLGLLADEIDVTKALNDALAAGNGLATLELSSQQAGRVQWALWLYR